MFQLWEVGSRKQKCEEEAVDFMINGVVRGYDASLCAQAVRSSVGNMFDRNMSAQQERKEGVSGPKIKTSRKGDSKVTGDLGMGEMDSGRTRGGIGELEREQPKTLNAEWMEWAVERHQSRGGAQGKLSHVSMKKEWTMDKEGSSLLGFDWIGLEMETNKVNSVNSVLRSKWEKLRKNQVKYWVELADEDDEGNKENKAIIPVQPRVIGELSQGLKEVSLKRKGDENEESPPRKRRKGHQQDSPVSVGRREVVVAELQAWEEEEEEPGRYGYNYEGVLDFDIGDCYRVNLRPKRKV